MSRKILPDPVYFVDGAKEGSINNGVKTKRTKETFISADKTKIFR